VFGRNLDPLYYDWKYGSQSFSYTSFVALYDGEVVAHIAYSYANYTSAEGFIIAARRHSSFVMLEHRGKGVFGKLLNYSSEELSLDGVRLVIGYPNVQNLSATIKNKQTIPLMQLPLMRRVPDNKTALKTEQFLCSNEIFVKLSEVSIGLIGLDQLVKFNYNYSLRKDAKYLLERYVREPGAEYYIHSLGDSLIVLKEVLFSDIPTVAVVDVIGDEADIALNIIEFSSRIPLNLQLISMCNFSNPTLIGAYLKSGFVFSDPIFSVVLLDLYDDLLTSDFYENRGLILFNLGDTDVI